MTNLSKPPTRDDIKHSLAAAIRERRHESVPHLLALMTRTAPADAEVVYGAMLAVLDARTGKAQQAARLDRDHPETSERPPHR